MRLDTENKGPVLCLSVPKRAVCGEEARGPGEFMSPARTCGLDMETRGEGNRAWAGSPALWNRSADLDREARGRGMDVFLLRDQEFGLQMASDSKPAAAPET